MKKLFLFLEWFGALICLLLAVAFGIGLHTLAFAGAALLLLPESRIHEFIKSKLRLKDAVTVGLIIAFIIVGSVSLIVSAASFNENESDFNIDTSILAGNLGGNFNKNNGIVASTSASEETVASTDAKVATTDATTAQTTTETTTEATTTEVTTTEVTTTEVTTTEATTVATTTTEETTTKATTKEEPSYSSVTYVLNKNTKKFHYMSCSSVETIKPKNYKESNESRDAIISQGYVPCKRCHP